MGVARSFARPHPRQLTNRSTMEVEQTAGREPGFMATTLLWPRVLARIFDESWWEDVGAKRAPMLTNRTMDVPHTSGTRILGSAVPPHSQRWLPRRLRYPALVWHVSRFQ